MKADFWGCRGQNGFPDVYGASAPTTAGVFFVFPEGHVWRTFFVCCVCLNCFNTFVTIVSVAASAAGKRGNILPGRLGDTMKSKSRGGTNPTVNLPVKINWGLAIWGSFLNDV